MATRKKAIPIVDERVEFGEECVNCKFYESDEEESKESGNEGGYCLRYPPTLVITSDGVGSGVPPVNAEGWCGEWKAKLNA